VDLFLCGFPSTPTRSSPSRRSSRRNVNDDVDDDDSEDDCQPLFLVNSPCSSSSYDDSSIIHGTKNEEVASSQSLNSCQSSSSSDDITRDKESSGDKIASAGENSTRDMGKKTAQISPRSVTEIPKSPCSTSGRLTRSNSTMTPCLNEPGSPQNRSGVTWISYDTPPHRKTSVRTMKDRSLHQHDEDNDYFTDVSEGDQLPAYSQAMKAATRHSSLTSSALPSFTNYINQHTLQPSWSETSSTSSSHVSNMLTTNDLSSTICLSDTNNDNDLNRHIYRHYGDNDDVTIKISNVTKLSASSFSTSDTTTTTADKLDLDKSDFDNPVFSLLKEEMNLSTCRGPFSLPPPATRCISTSSSLQPQQDIENDHHYYEDQKKTNKNKKKTRAVIRNTSKLVTNLLKKSSTSPNFKKNHNVTSSSFSECANTVISSPAHTTTETWLNNHQSNQGDLSTKSTPPSSQATTPEILMEDSNESILYGSPLRITNVTKDMRRTMKSKSSTRRRNRNGLMEEKASSFRRHKPSHHLQKSASFSHVKVKMKSLLNEALPKKRRDRPGRTDDVSTDAVMGRNEDYLPPVPAVHKTSYEEMDDVIQGRLDGIDAISLGSARSISYISPKQKHLAGQRYTNRSMIDEMLWGSCGSERPEMVLEGFGQNGHDRWIVGMGRRDDWEAEVGGLEGGCGTDKESLEPPTPIRLKTEDWKEVLPPLSTDVALRDIDPGLLCDNYRRTTKSGRFPFRPQQSVDEQDEKTDDDICVQSCDHSEPKFRSMPHHVFMAQIWGKENPPPPSHSLHTVGPGSSSQGDEDSVREFNDDNDLSAIVSCPFYVDKGIFVLTTHEHLKDVHDAAVAPLKKGRFEDSICMFHTIINSLKESSEKIPNYVLGAAFHNLGVVQMWAGRYEESLENLLHAINVRTRILGPLHALVAVSLVKAGFVYFALERLDQCLMYFEKALEIRCRVLQRDHLESAKISNNIGVVYYQKGKYTTALRYFTEALQTQKLWTEKRIRRQSLIFETSVTLSNMGKVYLACDDYDMACTLYEKALMLHTSAFNKDHDVILEGLGNVAFAKVKRGEKNNALQIYRKMHNSLVAKFGSQSREAAEIIGLMSTIHMQQFNYKSAEKCLNDVLHWQTSNLDEHHPAISNTRFTIEKLKQAINGEVRVIFL